MQNKHIWAVIFSPGQIGISRFICGGKKNNVCISQNRSMHRQLTIYFYSSSLLVRISGRGFFNNSSFIRDEYDALLLPIPQKFLCMDFHWFWSQHFGWESETLLFSYPCDFKDFVHLYARGILIPPLVLPQHLNLISFAVILHFGTCLFKIHLMVG